MNHITFAHPYLLLLLLVIPLMAVWYVLRYRKQKPALQFSNISLFRGVHKTFRQRAYPLLFILRMVAVGALVIALARPQSMLSRQEMKVEGIDIVLAMDVSGSMLAEDFKPNRLEAAKKVAAEFIDGRKNDRMGLVVFAGEAFTQVPLTIDHNVLLKQLSTLKDGMMKDGTALGDGLATAINRIKDSEAKSKVIILLTDGINNQGAVDPQSAAEIAALSTTYGSTPSVWAHKDLHPILSATSLAASATRTSPWNWTRTSLPKWPNPQPTVNTSAPQTKSRSSKSSNRLTRWKRAKSMSHAMPRPRTNTKDGSSWQPSLCCLRYSSPCSISAALLE